MTRTVKVLAIVLSLFAAPVAAKDLLLKPVSWSPPAGTDSRTHFSRFVNEVDWNKEAPAPLEATAENQRQSRRMDITTVITLKDRRQLVGTYTATELDRQKVTTAPLRMSQAPRIGDDGTVRLWAAIETGNKYYIVRDLKLSPSDTASVRLPSGEKLSFTAVVRPQTESESREVALDLEWDAKEHERVKAIFDEAAKNGFVPPPQALRRRPK